MNIALKMNFEELGVLRLLQALAEHNADLIRKSPGLPLLYESCVVYKREQDETFCDFPNMLHQLEEDCDGLAAARAGELMARGYKALREGDGGYADATRLKLASIPAQVMLTTHTSPGEPGLYHCIVRYWVNGVAHRDDPSARLGMVHNRVDPRIVKSCHLINLNTERWRTA